MTSDITKDYYDDEWEKTLDVYGVREFYERQKEQAIIELGENADELISANERFFNCSYEDLTSLYYNLISDSLQNNLKLYYNGALIVDVNSDPSTFIDQDVDNIIK